MSKCCCSNVYRICDVIVCDANPLVLPVPIPSDGDYTLELDFLNSVVRKTATLSLGDNATFEDVPLNEQYTYTGRVMDAAGDPVTFEIDEIEYDCFQFSTKRIAA